MKQSMSNPAQKSDPAQKRSDASIKRRTVAVSLAAAAVITFLKLWSGMVSGSIGMLSEAVHSGLDLIASIIVLASVTVSDRPADEAHSYGHGKMENLAAFTETLLMIASVLWIVVEAIKRISGSAAPLRLSVWPFAVLLLSIVVDFLRSRALG
ncbi:MAG: cation diffusion facilitator family transporter, partial [Acidobacteriaceae bacterium]